MKAIAILLDTLNRHFLPAYGNPAVMTPALDKFAARSIRFDNHWLGSAPCIPARRDMLTGRLNFLERGWGGMEPYDICLPHLLAEQGTHSHIETDHYHYTQGGGEFYHTTFSTWRMHRGQEFDPIPAKIDPDDNLDPELMWNHDIARRNRLMFKDDLDFPSPRTLDGAAEWLRMNEESDNYLLWVEPFDPHSPMDYPPEYDDLYDDSFDELFPISALPENCTEEFLSEMKQTRRRYAALLSMTDKWLGELFDEIDRQRGWDDTLVILTTDHGLMHGEHGLANKNPFHAWNEISHIPLLLHLPGGKHAGETRSQMTQNVDLFPTLLEYFGVPFEHTVHGVSFLDVAKADTASAQNSASARETAIYGWYGKTVNITDGRYTYLRGPASKANSPLYHYFLMPTEYHRRIDPGRMTKAEFGRFLPHLDIPVMRVPGIPEFGVHDEIFQNRLFDLLEDPAQTHDVCGTEAESVMIEKLIASMKNADAPPEQFDRLGLASFV